MTDCILKVFNNLMCASLPKRSTKDQKHRGISDHCFLLERRGRWRRDRENSFVSLCLPLGSPRCFWALIISFVVSKTSRVVHVYHTFQPSTRGLCGTAQVSSGKKDFSQRKVEIQWRSVRECVLMCFFRFPIMAALLPFSVLPPSSVVSRMDAAHTHARARAHTLYNASIRN